MIWQSFAFAVCMLIFWTIGHARGCDDQQIKISERCCNKCPPGTYMAGFCSDEHETVCKSCPEGHFSIDYTAFDRCEPCQSCQQEYSEKCTPTTNATCSCRSGFLCSNSICSVCEENKCAMRGEKPKRTEIPSDGTGVTKYSYDCEPCPEHTYFDAGRNSCEPSIRCSVLGYAERFPGNKTHPPVCDKPDMQRDSSAHVILGIGCVSLSVGLLLFLSYICMRNQRKGAESKSPVPAASTNNSEFHLSKEESGLQLISQTESKNSNSLDEEHLEKVISL